MIFIKTREEIELMRESALCVSKTLGMLASELKEGVELAKLDKLAEEFIRDLGGKPSFKGYGGTYPASLCISVNDAVVHGNRTRTGASNRLDNTWKHSSAEAQKYKKPPLD